MTYILRYIANNLSSFNSLCRFAEISSARDAYLPKDRSAAEEKDLEGANRRMFRQVSFLDDRTSAKGSTTMMKRFLLLMALVFMIATIAIPTNDAIDKTQVQAVVTNVASIQDATMVVFENQQITTVVQTTTPMEVERTAPADRVMVAKMPTDAHLTSKVACPAPPPFREDFLKLPRPNVVLRV